jgi:hypothetical protein
VVRLSRILKDYREVGAVNPDTQQILTSILRTAHQRGLDSVEVLTTLLRALAPIVSPHVHPTSVSVN